MPRLYFAFLAALIALAAPARAETVRLKLVQVEDKTGFDRPLPAFSIMVPVDWKTEGGIVWSYNATSCGTSMPHLNWQATGPDGVSAVQLVPSESYGGTNYAGSTDGCPQVLTTRLEEFMSWYVQRYRKGVRNYSYRARPEYAEELNKSASRTPTALGGEMQLYAEAGEATFEWNANGQTVRERVGLVTVFSVTRNPGGYLAVQVTISGGVSLRAPGGGDPARYEILASTFRPVPGYLALIQEFQARMQAIALKGVMDRAAIWRQAQAEISQMISEVYANAQATYDRVARDRSRQIRDVTPYVDPQTGQVVELPTSHSAWQLGDGTWVISDDPNFDPQQDLGEPGTKVEPAPAGQ